MTGPCRLCLFWFRFHPVDITSTSCAISNAMEASKRETSEHNNDRKYSDVSANYSAVGGKYEVKVDS